jgi:chromosome segregation ATPase
MGILAFLTASRLKAELTRQRDEIARLHQMLDMEFVQKQEAEKQIEEHQRQVQSLSEERRKLKDQLKEIETKSVEDKKQLKSQLEQDRKRFKEEAANKIGETEAQLAKTRKEAETQITTLRKELEEKQKQRYESSEQNATLAEKVKGLETRLQEQTDLLQKSEARIEQLQSEKSTLEIDLKKIMGNLTRW